MPRSSRFRVAVPSRDRVRCLIKEVREDGSRVKIVLSKVIRFHPPTVEAEVYEVSEHIIEIKAMAREAGFRTKIAVSSIDSRSTPSGLRGCSR